VHDFSTPADFRSRYANCKVKGGSKTRTAAQVWLESPKRRSYGGITFLPGKDAGDHFNLFQGFAVEPADGDCSLYLDHIRNNICSADDELYDYIIHWMADAIQNPSSRPGVALAIRGQQGVGKGVFVSMFAKLFGPHFIQVTQSNHLVGNFNGHQKDKLLVFADEAFWAGNKQAEGVLKGLVTEDTLSIEMKGVDVGQFPNFIRLILATNNDWVVPASAEQRRFVVIDASAARIQDTAYFGAIIHQMENGGLEALMHHLLSVDLEGVNLRKIPQTDALADQKLRSLDSVATWLYGCLDNGGIEETDTSFTTDFLDWPASYGTKKMHNAYLGHCKRVGQNHPERDTVFGKSLQKYLPSISKRREGGKNRQHAYLLPTLDQARQEFALATKIPKPSWEDDRQELFD
jgi:phage/plasmid-associated DNA primase